MAKLGADVTGVDASSANIEMAKVHGKGLGIRYLDFMVEDLVEKERGSFDIVTSFEVLEHVKDPSLFLKAISQLVKEDGHVFFSTINKTTAAYLLTILGAEHVFGWVPVGTHDYEKYVKIEDLKKMMQDVNLDCVNVMGLTFDPVYSKWKESDDLSCNYFVYGVPRKSSVDVEKAQPKGDKSD